MVDKGQWLALKFLINTTDFSLSSIQIPTQSLCRVTMAVLQKDYFVEYPRTSSSCGPMMLPCFGNHRVVLLGVAKEQPRCHRSTLVTGTVEPSIIFDGRTLAGSGTE